MLLVGGHEPLLKKLVRKVDSQAAAALALFQAQRIEPLAQIVVRTGFFQVPAYGLLEHAYFPKETM